MRSESKSDSAKTPLRVWIFYKNMGADFAGVELFGTGPKFKGKNTSSAALLNVPDKKNYDVVVQIQQKWQQKMRFPFLKKIGLRDDDKCSFCNKETENLEMRQNKKFLG